MREIALAVLIVLGTVWVAHAQSAGPPSFSLGDSWKRSNGLDVTVVNIDNNHAVMTGLLPACAACLLHFNNDFQIVGVRDASGKSIDIMQVPGFVPLGSSWRIFDWPLAVGKSWSFSAQGAFKGSLSTYKVDTTIATYEEVKTKAGTFKAYKMQRSWSVERAQGSQWTDTLWYAPDVRSAVKFTSSNRNTADWELVSYGLK